MFVFSSWFPWPVCPPSWLPCLLSLCCSESEDSEIRTCEFIPATACVLFRFFFLYFEFISGFDALRTVLNSWLMHTLPIEQAYQRNRFFFSGVMTVRPDLQFDRCWTSMSVSLSLSFIVIVIVIHDFLKHLGSRVFVQKHNFYHNYDSTHFNTGKRQLCTAICPTQHLARTTPDDYQTQYGSGDR